MKDEIVSFDKVWFYEIYYNLIHKKVSAFNSKLLQVPEITVTIFETLFGNIDFASGNKDFVSLLFCFSKIRGNLCKNVN